MESGDLAHLSMEMVVMNLMLYSASPQGRRLFEKLLVGDPYNIDIKLDKDSKNRNAEIINVMLKTMGLRLKFNKIPKQKKMLFKRVMAKNVPNSDYKPKTNILELIGDDGLLERRYKIAQSNKDGEIMFKRIMAKKVNKDDE